MNLLLDYDIQFESLLLIMVSIMNLDYWLWYLYFSMEIQTAHRFYAYLGYHENLDRIAIYCVFQVWTDLLNHNPKVASGSSTVE